MDKVKLEFKVPEKQTIEYNGKEFELTPFLGAAEQVFLIDRYLFEYFAKPEGRTIQASEYNYFEAEFNLKNYILQAITSIETEGMNNDFYFDTSFWNMLTSKILNYDDFRSKLNHIVMEIKEQKILHSSLGEVLSGLIEKLSKMLDNVANVSPEELAKLQKETAALADRIEKSSVLSDTGKSEPE